MKVLSPFGPKIAVLKIPKSIIKKINDEFEKIIKDKNLTKKNDYSKKLVGQVEHCLLYTSPSPRDVEESRMPSSA